MERVRLDDVGELSSDLAARLVAPALQPLSQRGDLATVADSRMATSVCRSFFLLSVPDRRLEALMFAQPVEDRLRQPFGAVPIHIVFGAFCHQHLRRAYTSGELGGERRRGKEVMLARDEEHWAGDSARF